MKEIEYNKGGRGMSEYGHGARNRASKNNEARNWEHVENNFDEIVNKSLQRIPYIKENVAGVRRLDDPIRAVDDPEFNNMHGNPIREAKVENSEMLDSKIHDSEFLKTDRQSYKKYTNTFTTSESVDLDFMSDGNVYVINVNPVTGTSPTIYLNIINLPTEHAEITFYLNTDVAEPKRDTAGVAIEYYRTNINIKLNSILVKELTYTDYTSTTKTFVKINHHESDTVVLEYISASGGYNQNLQIGNNLEYKSGALQVADLFKLASYTKEQLLTISATSGTVVYCSNAVSATGAPVYHNGTNWVKFDNTAL